MVDGSVRFLSNETSVQNLRNMATRAGGEMGQTPSGEFLRGLRRIRSSYRRRSLRFPEPIQHDPTDLGQGQGRAVQRRVLLRPPIGIVEVDDRARGNLPQVVNLEMVVRHGMLTGGDEFTHSDSIGGLPDFVDERPLILLYS